MGAGIARYRCAEISVFTFLLLAGCSLAEAPRRASGGPQEALGIELDQETLRRARQHSPLPPLPPSPTNRWADHEGAAKLGQFLFFDKRLSADGSVACSTCHDPGQSFADDRQLAEGLSVGRRHSPALWNVAFNRWFFWDGRADTLWTQALAPLESEVEHGSSRAQIAELLRADPGLSRAYEEVFGEAVQLETAEDVTRVFTNVGKAIAAYERKLISKSSRFDRFIAALDDPTDAAGDYLAAAELRGLELFVGRANCRLCHAGPLFSDREFHDTRVPLLHEGQAPDSGRYGGIAALQASEFRGGGEFSDDPESRLPEPVLRGETWGEFKTPTLRNVATSPPYMHQGQLASLRDVVHFYSTLENARPPHDHGETTMVPLGLSEGEIDDLVAFLGALTDVALAPELLKQPESPSARSAD